ncbi:MAG: hypothetical protein JXA19_07055 [Anaerolineales bacterium]|nr:hypothetical protein [Anaerolineales bacterium]
MENIYQAVLFGINQSDALQPSINLLINCSKFILLFGNVKHWLNLVNSIPTFKAGDISTKAQLQLIAGDLCYQVHDITQAQQHYKLAHEILPDNCFQKNWSSYALARTYWAMGKYDDAYDFTDHLLNSISSPDSSLDQYSTNLLTLLGMIQFSLRKFPASIRSFRKALRQSSQTKHDPHKLGIIHHNLALAYIENKNYRKAFYQCNLARKLLSSLPFTPDKINIELTRGTLLFRIGNANAAKKIFQNILIQYHDQLSLQQEARLSYLFGQTFYSCNDEGNAFLYLTYSEKIWNMLNNQIICKEIGKSINQIPIQK